MKVENGVVNLYNVILFSDPKLQKILVLLFSSNETKFPAKFAYYFIDRTRSNPV